MTRVASTVRAVAVGGLGCVAYGCLIERRWYRLRHETIPGVLRRPGTLRVLHVTDLHLSRGQQHRIEFLNTLARFEYDVVVATGDLLGAPAQEERTADALSVLTRDGRPGIVVLGSNDFYAPRFKRPWSYLTDPQRRVHGEALDTALFVDLLARHGYHTLRGETAVVTTAAGDVVFGGFDDPHMPGTVLPTPSTVAPPRGSDAIAHLGVVHAPYAAALDVLTKAGHDLILTGHTHGGQVRLPGFGALTVNCDLPLSQARGLSRHADAWLHVSAGLGHSPYAPFRFACRPEASVLTLSG